MTVLQVIGLLAGLAAAAQAEEQARPAERYVRIGHYQCRCRQGDFETNRKTVLHGLTLAEEARVQIMTFPESFLTGYFRHRDEGWKHSFALDSPEMRQVQEQTARFDILFMVGFNERRGDQLLNTVAVIDRGGCWARTAKRSPADSSRPAASSPCSRSTAWFSAS